MRYALKIFYACTVIRGEKHIIWRTLVTSIQTDDLAKCEGMDLVDVL